MRYFIAVTAACLIGISCREAKDSVLPCKEITPGEVFEAKIHDTWCLPDESVKITLESIPEDSRCNVQDIICVWAGRTVIELGIQTNEVAYYKDTLYAVDNWQGAITIGSRTLSVEKILPEQRSDFVTDTAAYRFQMVLE